MQIVFGSKNPGKIEQMQASFSDLPVTIIMPTAVAPVETGTSYTENALLKARYYKQQYPHLAVFADDSGLEVEALVDQLGVATRRFGAGEHATDSEWIAHFLEKLLTETNRRARFVSTIAFISPDGTEHIFTGECHGAITHTVEFPYQAGLPASGCFLPDGHTCVLSEIIAKKLPFKSHRALSIEQLVEFIRSSLL